MLIEAISTIVAFDGTQMVVINTGEKGELRDDLAEQEIAAGKAKAATKGKAKADPLDHDGDGVKGGAAKPAEEAAAGDDKAP